MKVDRWQRVKDLYSSALELAPEKREQYLREACAGDEELRTELERLLARRPEAAEFLETPAMDLAARELAIEQHPGPASSFVGRTLLHYRIVEKIGAGGMGDVYRARDEHLERDVAIKVLPLGALNDGTARSRFRKEALALSKLNHPNICTVYDFNEQEGRHLLAMEFVEGNALSRLIGPKGLPLKDALNYAVQMADALGKAHAAGIVHRDLKPSNIMVRADGLVKILDFGLAKRIGPSIATGEESATLSAASPPVTEAGTILGTVDYMSPEQAEGKPVDPRSDIFSFGSVLYEMLTGQRPFSGETSVSTLAAIITKDPAPPSEISGTLPLEVEQVVLRCLRKEPQRRIQTMLDLKVLLQDLREESESGKLSAPREVPPRPRRIWPVVVLSACVLTIVGFWLAWRGSRPSPEAPISAVTRLTWESGVSIWPAISQDGKLLAYASDRYGAFDIFVLQLGGQQAMRRTQDAANDWQPSFSPDGSKIAFRSEREAGGIYVMDTLGGPERKIADDGYHPRFSPDGGSVLFVMDSPLTRRGRMFLVSANGGAPKPFQSEFRLPRWGWIQRPPIWSPDGKYILFEGSRPGDLRNHGWWVAPAKGGEAVRLGTPPAARVGVGGRLLIAWRGEYVYYIEGTGIGVMVFARVKLAEDPWRISGRPEILLEPPGMLWGGSISAEGRIVFSSVQQPVPNIWAVGLVANKGLVLDQPEAVTTDSARKLEFTVAADGSILAYCCSAPPNDSIRVLDSAGSREYQVRGTGALAGPRLSADGSFLAYGELLSGRYHSFVTQPGAAAARQVCEGCLVQGFFSNPAEVLADYGESVARLDVVSGRKVTLMDTRGLELLDFAVSPGDRWIAFTMPTPEDTAGLYLSPVGETPTRQSMWIPIASERRYVGSPAWSPDGRLLYYGSNRDGFTCVWAQRISSTGKPDGDPFAVYHDHKSSPSAMVRGAATVVVTPEKLFMLLFEFRGSLWSAPGVGPR